jgi:hypothetical protein
MEDYRSFDDDDLADWDFPAADEPCMELPPMIGAEERRMHIRAYEYWLSLLNGRDYPARIDLDLDAANEFAPYSVLLDFSKDRANPAIIYLGKVLRDEAELGPEVRTVSDVPRRALLSRLTDHYAEILDNRAPVGFEAEFIGDRGRPMLSRGILMPYSSDGHSIDLIHGVINWKEPAEQALSPDIVQAVTTVFAGPAQPLPEPPAEAAPVPPAVEEAPALGGLVEDARRLAGEAADSESRGRRTLYRALSVAYDLALAAEADREGFAAILAEAGIPGRTGSMTPIIKLVLGADRDRKRVAEFAAVLNHARRLCLAAGSVEHWLHSRQGGIKAIVDAERRERRPALRVDRVESARMMLGGAPARAVVDLGAVEDDVVLLVARREPDGKLAIVSRPIAERSLVDKALQRFTA